MPPKQPRIQSSRNTPQKVFGAVPRELRQQRGDSQDAFAHRTGYHRNYVGQLERGEGPKHLREAVVNIVRSGCISLTDGAVRELRRLQKREQAANHHDVSDRARLRRELLARL